MIFMHKAEAKNHPT